MINAVVTCSQLLFSAFPLFYKVFPIMNLLVVSDKMLDILTSNTKKHLQKMKVLRFKSHFYFSIIIASNSVRRASKTFKASSIGFAVVMSTPAAFNTSIG